MKKQRRHKVVARPSHTAYRWRHFAESLGLVLRFSFFLASAAVLAWGAYHAWKYSPGLMIQGVEAETSLPEGFIDRAGIKSGEPFFGFSTRKLEKRLLEEFPQLKEVRIRRGLDRRVHIAAAPRQALARTLWEKGWMGVDEKGVFPMGEEGPGLPVLAGVDDAESAKRLLAFWRVLGAAKESWTDSLYKIRMSSDGEAVLFLRGETLVYWGAPDLEPAGPKAARLSRVLAAPEAAQGFAYVRFVEDRRLVAKPVAAPKRPNG